MRWSRAFIPTLRDNPADAESLPHQLLLRGGFVRQPAPGVYSYLPLGQRTMLKIVSIVREEFSKVGAQEFSLPILHPGLRREAARCNDTAGNMIQPKDPASRDLCLSMTHEEVFAEIARREVRSYRDLPQIWYQIHMKFHGEARPKAGLARRRQFIVKDSCSFDANCEGLENSCRTHYDLYCRIFTRCGLEFVTVEEGSESMGGNLSQRFVVRADAGEDFVAACSCGYAASLERASSRLPEITEAPAAGEPREVYTPDKKTIAEIAEFLSVPPAHQIKSLVYASSDRPYLFLVRGDHQLSETKATAAVRGLLLHPAQPEEIRAAFGADAGSLGPVGIEAVPVYADVELRGRANLTCGANRNDYHLQGVTPDVHFKPIWADLRMVGPGEACVRCGKPLEVYRAVEVGHLLGLGTTYSESMGANVLSPDGKQTPIVMGSYGVDLERIMCSAVELHHDGDGIMWPPSIAPFSAVVTPVNYRDETRAAADRLYAELTDCGIDALLDDRAERPGVKFKDADLIGIPYRIVIASQKLQQGKAELFERATKTTELLDLDSVVPVLSKRLAEAIRIRRD